MNTLVEPAAPRARVAFPFVATYALAYFSIFLALLTPVVVTLALRVAQIDPAHKESSLSWILGAGAAVAMVANPVAGLFCDRTTSRLGMRRPWLVGGLAVGMLGLYLVATGGLALIGLGWCIAQLGYNAVLAAIVAILPDQVPEAQRGSVSGVLGICLQLGIVAGVFLTQYTAGSTVAMFMVPAAIGALLVLALVAVLRDRIRPSAGLPRLDLLAFVKSFWIDPRVAPDFAWAFASRFLLMIGISILLTYQVYYLIDHLHFRPDQIPAAMTRSMITNTLATVVGSLISGWWSDRLGRRKVFVLAAALIYACGLALIGLANRFDAFQVGNAIAGLGQGVYLAIDLALVTAVLPNRDQDAAKDLGIFNIASAMPQSLAPAIAPAFLVIGAGSGAHNYTALFMAAAAFAGAGALAILPIRAVR
ncbi:MAG: MFS transporter [Burkholderiales bacterium]|nr:MFS transporter [Burkholderiales bacterium]MDE1926225.1 MFS transporter [Burkholderiales bacterium]MDE2159906.1 MFS transporter [Burkholderiales bacterium]MDE2501605.1 MFS transporter [Burkholderiales bacterium]